MTVEVNECIRGCSVTVGIEGEESSRIPAVAAPGGLLCPRCIGRLGWRIGDVSDVAARARLALVPGLGASTDGSERVSGSKEPQLPFNALAMETCDLVVSVIADWCVYWARELVVRAPAGLVKAAESEGVVSGVRAGSTPEQVADALETWAWWLRVHMPAILAHEQAGRFHDAVDEVVEKAERRFPREEVQLVWQKPRYCPICEVQKVRVTWQGVDPLVQCGACLWVFETEWRELLDAIGISGGAE